MWKMICIGITAVLVQNPVAPRNGGFDLSVDVDLVVVNATVLDTKGHRVRGLSKDNFRIVEDGRAEQIRFVEPEDVPATVGLVIDNSGSMRDKRADNTNAAIGFVDSSDPRDELFVVNFNENVSMGLPPTLPFTRDLDQLHSALLASRAEGKTALYDAVIVALQHLEQGSHQKKALVVLSDGGDNVSDHTLADALAAAEQSNATIYTIGIYGAQDKDKNPKVLKQLAQLTGGEVYLPERLEDLAEIWQKVAAGIRSQYTIGYVSSNPKHDGTYRNVVVVASDKDGRPLRVLARKGYLAPTGR